jgi:hypothetical protein
MTDVLEALKSAQFLVDANGQRVAVQLSIEAWAMLLDWMEDREDAAIVKAAIPKLKQLQSDPSNAQWLDWNAVKTQWNED